MRKRIMYLLLCCLFLMGTVSASAAELTKPVEENPAPRMDFIMNASCSLYIDAKGIATVKVSAYGYPDITTDIFIDAELQQMIDGNWVTIAYFSTSSDLYRASLSETYSTSNGTYRVQATIFAYADTDLETRLVTSSEATY